MNKFDNIKKLIVKDKLKLDCGQTITDFPIAYETYGQLNSKKDNAILVFHALTGDQFASDINPITKKDGWWKHALGQGKAIDTDKYFVICANVLGGCMGSFGPSSLNPKTGEAQHNWIMLNLGTGFVKESYERGPKDCIADAIEALKEDIIWLQAEFAGERSGDS